MKTNKLMRRAFTLIELLVTITIISILAAILFPVFARARASARRTSCQNNLKQIALGIIMYTQDNDSTFPPVQDSTNDGWVNAVLPYVKTMEMFQCPEEEIAYRTDKNSASTRTDYWMNDLITETDKTTLAASSLTVLTGEGGGLDGSSGHAGGSTNLQQGTVRYTSRGQGTVTKDKYRQVSGARTQCPAAYTEASDFATEPNAQIHLDGANYAFADGHVKWFKGDTVSTTSAISVCGGTSRGKPTFVPTAADYLKQ